MGSRHHPMTGATEGRGWNPQTSDPNVRPLLPLRCPKGGPGGAGKTANWVSWL